MSLVELVCTLIVVAVLATAAVPAANATLAAARDRALLAEMEAVGRAATALAAQRGTLPDAGDFTAVTLEEQASPTASGSGPTGANVADRWSTVSSSVPLAVPDSATLHVFTYDGELLFIAGVDHRDGLLVGLGTVVGNDSSAMIVDLRDYTDTGTIDGVDWDAIVNGPDPDTDPDTDPDPAPDPDPDPDPAPDPDPDPDPGDEHDEEDGEEERHAPRDKDDCKNGGWETFTDPSFRNQGLCVAWIATGRAFEEQHTRP